LRGKLNGDSFTLVGPQESHALFALSQADALVRLEPNQEVTEGETLEALLIS
jgi:molybdopterin molybdotransferase